MLLLLLFGRVNLLAGCGLRHLSDLAIVLKHRLQLKVMPHNTSFSFLFVPTALLLIDLR